MYKQTTNIKHVQINNQFKTCTIRPLIKELGLFATVQPKTAALQPQDNFKKNSFDFLAYKLLPLKQTNKQSDFLQLSGP